MPSSLVFFFLFFVFLLIVTNLLAGIRWSLNPREFCVPFSRTDAGFCIWSNGIWSNFNIFHDSQWISFSSQLCLVLYTFWSNWLHSLIMWLIVLYLSPHLPTLVIRYVLSIFTLTSLRGCFVLQLEATKFLYYYYHYYLIPSESFTTALADCLHWNLNGSKFPQVSRTFVSILAGHNNTVVLTVSILPLISNSSSLFSKLLGTVPSAPKKIGVTAIFLSNSVFIFSAKILEFVSFLFTFHSVVR